MARTVAVTDATFKAEIYESVKPVLVHFGAVWCEPCTVMAPALNALAQERDRVLKDSSIDVDSNAASAASFGVHDVPTLILFKNGRPATRVVGSRTKDELMEIVTPHLF